MESFGDKLRAFVTQPNGQKQSVNRKFLLPDDNPYPLPGAVVDVPVRDPAQNGTSVVALLGTAAQLLASLVTVIVVAHRPALIQQLDHVLVLVDGQIQKFGATADILARIMPPSVHALRA